MKQLLLRARADEESFGDLYPSLLRLLTSHYPHLCLVEDWIEEEEMIDSLNTKSARRRKTLNIAELENGKNILIIIKYNTQIIVASIFWKRLKLSPPFPFYLLSRSQLKPGMMFSYTTQVSYHVKSAKTFGFFLLQVIRQEYFQQNIWEH